MKPTVLVTGGAGSMGRAVIEALGRKGLRVRALEHRRDVPDADDRVRGSILDTSVLSDAARGCAGVVHLAGLTHSRSPGPYRRVNLEGTRALVAAAQREPGIRFVFVSSRTATPTGGTYAVSKLEAEEAVRESELDWTIVRLPEVYGLGGNEGVDRILESARAGRRILIPATDVEVCPMYVDDAVAACVGALMSPQTTRRIYTLAGECMTLTAFAEACRARGSARARVVRIPLGVIRVACALSRVIPLPVYPDQLSRLMVAKPEPSHDASKELGFTPRALESGLESAFRRG